METWKETINVLLENQTELELKIKNADDNLQTKENKIEIKKRKFFSKIIDNFKNKKVENGIDVLQYNFDEEKINLMELQNQISKNQSKPYSPKI
ncbi:hypothetical protein [Spiroplasma endosymbiont of Colias croceus]|uniref:hypothetical protein n=1 Tax=Spiroplasma endosymbiont of Colias croceus TaxID=3066310 RepID=UPI0030CE8565